MKTTVQTTKAFIIKILKQALPPTILCLFLFFTNMEWFGYKNAVIAIPMAFILKRLVKLPPQKWHPFNILLINIILTCFAYLATLNVWLSVSVDFIITYLMIFFLTDSDTSRAYFSYGFAFVLFQSFATTFHEFGLRLIAVTYSSVVTFIVLFITFLLTKKESGFCFESSILNPFYHIKSKFLTFIKRFKDSFYNLLFILRIHLFSSDKCYMDKDSFDFRRTRFALRISLLVTFSFFLERIFDIPKGYWLPLNVFIMTLPFYEDSLVKIKQRIAGNIAGILASAVLLHFLRDYTWHMIILCVATFLGFAVDRYPFRAAYMTCYAIALSTLFMKESEIFELRLAYVLLAAIISIIGSRFIFINKKSFVTPPPNQ